MAHPSTNLIHLSLPSGVFMPSFQSRFLAILPTNIPFVDWSGAYYMCYGDPFGPIGESDIVPISRLDHQDNEQPLGQFILHPMHGGLIWNHSGTCVVNPPCILTDRGDAIALVRQGPYGSFLFKLADDICIGFQGFRYRRSIDCTRCKQYNRIIITAEQASCLHCGASLPIGWQAFLNHNESRLLA